MELPVDADKVRGILENLFSLRVSTIIKSNMMATKMPNEATALVDLVTDYGVKLRHLTSSAPESALAGRVSQATFEEIRAAAAKNIASREPPPQGAGASEADPSAWEKPDAEEEAELLMLCRIRDNSEQLKTFFKGKESLSFGRTEAQDIDNTKLGLQYRQKVALRKMWEIGTEEVAMQTVVYLDGDVITRLQPEYYQDPKKQPLIPIHNKAVETSISFWQRLVELAETFVVALTGKR